MLVIDNIIHACRKHFQLSVFNLHRKDYNNYVVSGDSLSKAMNRNEVNVLHWFDDFWIYIEIKFRQTEDALSQTTISISVFEGTEEDNYKTHLFRAEWDSFENNTKHPQQHWHIYPHKYNRQVYEEFEVFNDLKTEDGFEDNLHNVGLVDIKKIHFTMKGRWISKDGHIHTISEINSLVIWMDSILEHIKYKLEHAKNG